MPRRWKWHALRAELAYSRPYLLGGLGLAAGVVVIVRLVFFAVGDDGPPSHAAAGIRGMFLIMAPVIVGFIVQAYRSEERRARLLLAGPLTPRQLAGVTVLLLTALTATVIVFQGSLTWPSLHLGNLIVAVIAMVTTVVLYAGRTDFTR